jgi:uncharacterized protein (DUF983 family)
MNLPPHWHRAFHCKCPACGLGDIYQSNYSITLKSSCPSCGLDLSKNDSADGPAVFLIFVLGFLIVPLAVIVDFKYHWSLWMHLIIWSGLMLGITLLTLRPLKAFVIALQYRHRKTDWDDKV